MMKSIMTKQVLGFAFWGLSLVSLPALAQSQPAGAEAKLEGPQVAEQDADSSAPPELMKSAEAMLLAMNQKEVDKAFAIMSDKGSDQFIGRILMELVPIAQMEGALEPSDELEQLKEIVGKYGLDKVRMESPMLDGTESREKMAEVILHAMKKIETDFLACIPAGERRKATQELVGISGKIMASPISFELGKFEINGQQAEWQVIAKFPTEMADQQGDMDGRTLACLLFVKKENEWRFDGFNNKRFIEQILAEETRMAEPFKEIVDLAIEGKTIENEEISLASYKDKVVLVDFWGTWCGPCVAGIPKLTELHEKYRARGFEILGVAANDVDSLKKFLDKKPLAWKNVTDAESELATQYSIEAYPTTLLVDKHGKHVATNLHGAMLEKAVELLLEGKSIESITGTAKDILEAGKKRAAEEKKFIFLHFGAEWCGPCKVLEEWLAQPEIHAMFQETFIDVKIDVDRNFGAQELLSVYSLKAGGIPWFGILNATDDKPIAICEDKDGNVGIPDTPEGFDQFTKMFEATGKFSKEELGLIRRSISTAVEKYLSAPTK